MNTVLIYSGGLDSTVLLYTLLKLGHTVVAVSFDYGQRHVCELQAAQDITEKLGVEHHIINLSGLRHVLSRSALTGDAPVPDGHYADEVMKQTVVPNRNMIMLSAAAACAMTLEFDSIAYAAHAGDHTIYPDCRPEFVDAFNVLLGLADWHTLKLEAPFIANTKQEIVAMGAALGVPFDKVWSCYKGGDRHCGKCGTCVERREAFELAKVTDPTVYADEVSA